MSPSPRAAAVPEAQAAERVAPAQVPELVVRAREPEPAPGLEPAVLARELVVAPGLEPAVVVARAAPGPVAAPEPAVRVARVPAEREVAAVMVREQAPAVAAPVVPGPARAALAAELAQGPEAVALVRSATPMPARTMRLRPQQGCVAGLRLPMSGRVRLGPPRRWRPALIRSAMARHFAPAAWARSLAAARPI
ncbi:MAG TPA: hypothetical protein VKY65_10610 [Alphaproteobacteria bacterium]|nr:hypothetical protein [Alphaproteobacteria bacterium]